MNSSVRTAIISFVTLSAGCGGSNITQPPGPSVPMVRLRSEPYAFTFYSGLDKPARLVARDPAVWQAVWSQIYLRNSYVPPLPPVDFSQEMIVVVALGNRSTGGYNILLTGASEAAADGTVFMIRSVAPGPSCFTTQAFTQPVDIARVPLRNGAVSFIEQNHVTDCG